MLALACALLLPMIWIVAAQMGQGAHFADLPAAINAAANGDTILVRDGSYTGFYSNGKAVTLRGEGCTTTRIVGQPSGPAAHLVDTGGTFVPSGLRLEGGNPALLLLNATIELLDCEIVGAAGPGQGGPGMVVNSAAVTAARCTSLGATTTGQLVAVGGDGARVAVGSTFVADQCWFVADDVPGAVVRHDPVAVVGGVFGTVTLGQPMPRLQVVGSAGQDGTLDALQSVQVTLDGLVPNGFGFVAFGDPVFTPPAAPFASDLLVGGAGAAVFVTPLDATGRAQFADTPALIGGPLVGVPVHLQGGAWSPALGSVLTSNLAVHIAVP
ncbi:MAG: hypothetical protein ACK5UQ_12805 [Planctomycetota bacterium]